MLLYQWDIEHKRLKLPIGTIKRREKQEMLRLIAYEMQAGEEGLKGNLISADCLIRVLTDYLRNQGFSEPREKANLLIQQLRERNFVLCYRGAETYSFVHRTFLDYFCATEIVYCFEKQRTLTFEQLRDEIFGQHWQDKVWHEVLCLTISMIATKLSIEIINHFIEEAYEPLHLILLSQYFLELDNNCGGILEPTHTKLLGKSRNSCRGILEEIEKAIIKLNDSVNDLEAKVQQAKLQNFNEIFNHKNEETWLNLTGELKRSAVNFKDQYKEYCGELENLDLNTFTLDGIVEENEHLIAEKGKLQKHLELIEFLNKELGYP
ncbi:MAG: hypothetical protein AAF171_23865 [Cyanobacteria bacterium P01_A01_bin.116]